MQQRPEPHCQAAHAAVGRAHALADGNGIWSSPNLRLNHLFSFICQWSRLLANSGLAVPMASEFPWGGDVRPSRGAGKNELPVAKDHRDSRAKVRDAALEGRYRRGVLRRARAGASQAIDEPGLKERTPCQGLAADRLEASHCPAPVSGGHQPKPRSHDHGRAVQSFIALPGHLTPRSGSERGCLATLRSAWLRAQDPVAGRARAY